MNWLSDFVNWFVDFWNIITSINIASISLWSLLSLALTLIVIRFILGKVNGI